MLVLQPMKMILRVLLMIHGNVCDQMVEQLLLVHITTPAQLQEILFLVFVVLIPECVL